MRYTPRLLSKCFLYLFLAVIALTFSRLALAEEEFFSYKRFFLNQALVDRIPKDGLTQQNIREFSKRFTDGVYALSSDNLPRAEKDFLAARQTWPEYFGTDFLLALVYENQGDYDEAARYYKSYLNKLKNYHNGNYRISAPLIFSITSYEIEPYERAHKRVEKRLAIYGIDLATVRPMFTPPIFLIPIFSFIMIVILCLVSYYKVWPYMKQQYRRNNPPEGFWICRHCDNANTVLNKECQECRRPRE